MSLAKHATTVSQSAQTNTTASSQTLAIAAAILLGTLIVVTTGFASPELIHNAAHDMRHALAFPCH